MKPTAMHPAAEQELAEVAEYYEALGPDLADAFLDCFESYRITRTYPPTPRKTDSTKPPALICENVMV